MEDMQKNSTKVAYQLASPANRRFTAAPDGYNKELFDSMVRGNAYKPLVSGYGYTVRKGLFCHFDEFWEQTTPPQIIIKNK